MNVKTLCLGALTFGDASGYEIKKSFEEGVFSHLHHAGFGSIYPALGELSAAGLVSCTEMEQDGRPDKKVYGITDKGLDALRQGLATEPAPDKVRSEHLVMLLFAQYLEPSQCRAVFDGYLDRFRREVMRMEGSGDGDGGEEMDAGCRFVHGFGLAVYQAAASYMEENRHLLFGDEAAMADADVRRTGTSG